MASLTLKNIPDELLERLKAAAHESRRSLNREALIRVELGLSVRWSTPPELEARIRAAQARFADVAPLTDTFVDTAKSEGRA